ncbi:hypothetical protein [Pseudomonas sp. LRF_L74]|uniref:hypothetical protein n=1 Tax=Pseudomonas sp. LRF_L74 TaxID=3369422 RepID=UPI003F63892B
MSNTEERSRALAIRTLEVLQQLIIRVNDPEARGRLRERQIRLEERLKRSR